MANFNPRRSNEYLTLTRERRLQRGDHSNKNDLSPILKAWVEEVDRDRRRRSGDSICARSSDSIEPVSGMIGGRAARWPARIVRRRNIDAAETSCWASSGSA